jgi:hypothetical protein
MMSNKSQVYTQLARSKQMSDGIFIEKIGWRQMSAQHSEYRRRLSRSNEERVKNASQNY